MPVGRREKGASIQTPHLGTIACSARESEPITRGINYRYANPTETRHERKATSTADTEVGLLQGMWLLGNLHLKNPVGSKYGRSYEPTASRPLSAYSRTEMYQWTGPTREEMRKCDGWST